MVPFGVRLFCFTCLLSVSWPVLLCRAADPAAALADDYFPPADVDGGWRQLTGAREIRQVAGLDLEQLDRAFEVCRASTRNGGLLVVRRGWLVYERYFGLGHRDARPNLASVGKSFTSIAVGMLMADYPHRFPQGLEQRVYTPEYLPASAFPLSDPSKADIKLGQLLAFTAGIRGNNPGVMGGREVTLDPAGPDGASALSDRVAAGHQDTGRDGQVLSTRTLWCTPGAGYSYATASAHLASMLVRHVSGQEMEDYLRARLAVPIGWGPFNFAYRHAAGIDHTPGGGGIAARATDMLRFGYLLLREGRWRDRQIVPAEYVRHCGRKSPYNPHSAYSLQFDVNTDGQIAEYPRDAFWKSGSGAHMLYVVPSLDLVVWKLAGRDGQYEPRDTGVPLDESVVRRANEQRQTWRATLGEREGQRQVLKEVIAAVTDAANAAGPDATRVPEVPQFGVHERMLTARQSYPNPYTDLAAEVQLSEPDGVTTRHLPLFWDGGNQWKFRFSPEKQGTWQWRVTSSDPGLNGQTGSIDCVASVLSGSIRPRAATPHHFERQDGSPFWFLGDTAWALVTDNDREQHDRRAARRYLDARSQQGFNVVHTMLLSEAGWGNQGGLPFEDLAAEKINPGYWQEVDVRLTDAASRGLICGLALAWGDKRKVEPFAWRRFPSVEARHRYARYIAARYSAFPVYFLISGEWHGEVRTRASTEDEVRREFLALGQTLAAADPHERMIGIHPMTREGTVREFNQGDWMAFADYQQNYEHLHARILAARAIPKPVVNSEYGYLLRDQNGDGTPDKDNSTSLASMRHASWDIVMGGGYFVTGFGTTYFGGNRDPGPFRLDTPQNDMWENQLGAMQRFFTGMNWWDLEPHDEWLTSTTPRGEDGTELGRRTPPAVSYWLLAQPGRSYVVYARGLNRPLTVQLGQQHAGTYRVERLNPRTGACECTEEARPLQQSLEWTPPDSKDWVLRLTSAGN
ncbi:MAG: DUF4038 domain-containing protein [Pirellulaceae bacterium]